MKSLLTSASLMALCLTATLARAENWPSWRGPEGNGISKETGLPTTWDEKKNIRWSLKMPGIGGATPIVWGDRLFVLSGDGPTVVLICLNTDGKELWTKKIGTAGRGIIRKDEGNDASPTPTTDGKNIYVFTGYGDLAAFDFDGKELWKLNVQDKYGKFSIQHGMHSTPVLHEDHLYLNLLHGNGQVVAAFNKNTGKEVWKVHRKTDANGESKEAYTTPSLVLAKEPYLVVNGADYGTAHRLKDGSELWRVSGLNQAKYNSAYRVICSSVVGDGIVVVPSCRNGPMVAVSTNAQGNIKTGSGGELWRRATGAPDVPTPLVHDGLVYCCREVGVLLCLDAKTGQEVYSERLHDARHRASPVYADGKIYLVARDGVFTVVKAGRKFEKLAENQLPDDFTASPAVSGGRLYLRGYKTLYCVSEGAK